MKVALVVMPWWRVEFMPLGVATLKAHLKRNGVEADCLYLNLRMYRRIGSLAKALPNDLILAEWFFAYHLFGPNGTGELAHELEDVLRFRSSQRITDFRLAERVPRAALKALLHDEIPAFLEDCLENIPWANYDLVGFSSTYSSHTAALKLAREIKSRWPQTPIAFGGANVEGEMGAATIEACDWIDYVFDGESEGPLLELVRRLEAGRDPGGIPGLSYRRAGKIVPAPRGPKALTNLETLPDPDHDDYFEQLGDPGPPSEAPHVTFEASRGCWWGEKQNCTFCGLNGQAMTFRAKSSRAVLEMLLRLQRRYRCRYLQSCDNILGLDHIRGLLPLLAAERKKGTGEDWSVFFETKSNLTAEQIGGMAEAGVTHIQPGIESLSSPVLREMRKGVRAIQNVQTLKLAQARGIRSYWNYLFGFPGETQRHEEAALEIALSILHLQPPHGYGPVRIDRFSPFHFEWKKLGTGKPRPNDLYRLIYPETRFDLDRIAYHFDFPDGARLAGFQRLEKAIDYWMKIWPRVFLAYASLGDCVEVHDGRPAALGASPGYRSATFTGLEAAVLRCCETIKSQDQIVESCRAAGHGRCERGVRKALDQLVERRLVLREDGLYLGLALRESQLPAPQKVAMTLMLAAARDLVLRQPQLKARPSRARETS